LSTFLLPLEPVTSLDAYLAAGGRAGVEAAQRIGPDATIDVITRSGLRGRGGGGFPTGRKWSGIAGQTGTRRYVVCNGAEGEPGTFKDRYLLRHNPYQVIEGLAIASRVIGAERAFLCIKRHFEPERARVERAIAEMQAAGVGAEIELVLGPDEYLYGEEKAMLEVIEGGLPLPRVLPPYMQGLFGGAYGGPSEEESNPTAVNNVETLSHVTHIVRDGAAKFLGFGTEDTPGTMVFTVSGDVRTPTVVELPLGLRLRDLIFDAAGGPAEGRSVKAIFPGLANAVITASQLDARLGFDSMRDGGSALGSGGFIVYVDTACMAQVAYDLERFLFVESCNQCPPCKTGGRQMTERLEMLLEGRAEPHHLEEIHDIGTWVTNGARCYLATSQSLVTESLLASFPDDFAAHLRGTCALRHDMPLPKLVDYVEGQGFTYDTTYARKQPDWTYV
jgi:NADH:ubiquinone oxidoreductase subunit F (NADH-binding)